MYARNVSGRTLSFGVSGMLWRENLIMYDRETDSWWAQASGKAIQGEFEGESLTMMLSYMMTWKEWHARHPDTLVLSKLRPGRLAGDPPRLGGMRDTYATRYHGNSDIGVTGRTRARPSDIDAKERMAGFLFDGLAYAAKLDDLAAGQVVIAGANGQNFVVAGTPDGSGARAFLAEGHEFVARVGGGPGVLVDQATSSQWNAFDGRAISGSLAGTQLEEVPVTLTYWFAWQAFFPDLAVLRR